MEVIGLRFDRIELTQSKRYSEAHRPRESDMIDIKKRVADKQGRIRRSLKDWPLKMTHNAPRTTV
ncbi:hypothetical protein [Methylobacter sp. BBA5.1]|uniref:hypothetical protein n=1 Tax=Methylobacter sp. BBA5.1 TaxID=1495064 RepID=UPI00055C9F34|nr:hypothetical protein [Methylobacter sp. BBA5.1]